MIIAVYGSPRKNGNTEILMNEFLKPINKKVYIQRYHLGNLDLKPCISCGKCNKTGICIFNDDIWHIYENLEKAEGIIMASPIYFGSMSAQLKTFIDRAQPFWVRKYLLGETNITNKKGFLISAGAIKTNKYFDNINLIVKTHLNTLNIRYSDSNSIFFKGVDEKAAIRNIPNALDQVYLKGKEFID